MRFVLPRTLIFVSGSHDSGDKIEVSSEQIIRNIIYILSNLQISEWLFVTKVLVTDEYKYC